MHEEMTDEALMCAYRDGDGTAFEVLFRRHRAPLYRYLLRQCGGGVAEELSQDCWSKVIRARSNYTVSAKFSTWLFRIAHNRLIDHFRAHERTALASYDDAEALDTVLASVPDLPERRPDALLDRKQLGKRLLQAIARLPAPQRESFLLHVEGELSVEDIGNATGVGRETAKSRLRYALAALRTSLREEIK
jgi:RNA polymerase sigma-70 factor (ECF subfamily)